MYTTMMYVYDENDECTTQQTGCSTTVGLCHTADTDSRTTLCKYVQGKFVNAFATSYEHTFFVDMLSLRVRRSTDFDVYGTRMDCITCNVDGSDN